MLVFQAFAMYGNRIRAYTLEVCNSTTKLTSLHPSLIFLFAKTNALSKNLVKWKFQNQFQNNTFFFFVDNRLIFESLSILHFPVYSNKIVYFPFYHILHILNVYNYKSNMDELSYIDNISFKDIFSLKISIFLK